ncbi:type II toxin-antitoxin system PemK/MazF family toxin [Periweissella beninensis]|uniref:Type II toxin-antitoxin system PemK/MazF family toxin n=1 Tax=Periweissella beninensis TaxID=504936 RepID=A0ABT0VMY5_9LACO|nr:type II toxin-antitoxin system PemK/MazF family toxin [Periweissella beninensis]MBM7544423.1 mRNA interferase MazF [Periweissella beninensis]MCM2437890.1 type II toxin-antitoxin system PemK/MazF family toxin [Periweissella beninensis]MCT4396748.1 type II toxin-antitoxin system PemK/MazF family toxin [Periweissella beninensis]
MTVNDIKRGDIFYADLSPVTGSEQGGTRPVVIIQNNMGNHYSPTVIVAAITARASKTKLPTHVLLATAEGIAKDSVILLEQLRTIDKKRLKDRVAHLDDEVMTKVDLALVVSLGLLAERPSYSDVNTTTEHIVVVDQNNYDNKSTKEGE